MSRLNKQLFIFLNVVSLIFVIAVFLGITLELTKTSIFSGYTLRLLILAGIMSLVGSCALFWGDKVLESYHLPTSYKTLKYFIKGGVNNFFKEKKVDVIISVIIFIAAVFEVLFYNYQISLSSEVLPYYIYDLNPLWSEGVDNVFVVSDRSFMFVSSVWLSMKIINFISLFAPFITFHGIIFGIVITLYYSIFRLGMGRVTALICTILIMVSSTQLDHLIPFWDKYYFRAPFVLSFVFITGILIKRSFEPTGILFWTIVAGVLMGQGLMIRPDLLVFFPLIILTIVFFLPRSKKINIQLKVMAIVLFVCVTLLSFQRGSLAPSNNSHAFMNATSIYEQQVAGLKLPNYDWNYLLTDAYTSSISYAQSKVFNPNILFVGYGPVDEYKNLVISNFPADILTKFYGVVLKVLEMPFAYLLHPIGIKNEGILLFYELRASILSWFSGSGIWLWLVTVMIIGTSSLRKGIYCIILIPPLLLLPSIHLEGYYSFYLEFISYWTLGFVLNQIVIGACSIWKKV